MLNSETIIININTNTTLYNGTMQYNLGLCQASMLRFIYRNNVCKFN